MQGDNSTDNTENLRMVDKNAFVVLFEDLGIFKNEKQNLVKNIDQVKL